MKIYAEIPEFNQETQYIVQLPPVEQDGNTYYGVEVRNLDLEKNELVEI